MNAEIIRAVPNQSFPGAVIVTVLCPYCGKQHQHGIPVQDVDSGDYGGRVPHCPPGPMRSPEYHLTDPQRLVLAVSPPWAPGRKGRRP